VLPLPATSFSAQFSRDHQPRCRDSSRKKTYGPVGEEEGWEDGEDLGPNDEESEESAYEIDESDSLNDSDDGGGSWLEGRFQR